MLSHCPVCDTLVIGNESTCRACAAPLVGDRSALSLRMRWLVRARQLVLLNCLICPLPAGLMITPAGAVAGLPISLLLGLALVAAGSRGHYDAARRLGIIQCIVCLAYVPFLVMARLDPGLIIFPAAMSMVGICVLYFASLSVWHNHPGRELRWQCDRCGYLLQGLARPRCPECGTPFDPARVA